MIPCNAGSQWKDPPGQKPMNSSPDKNCGIATKSPKSFTRMAPQRTRLFQADGNGDWKQSFPMSRIWCIVQLKAIHFWNGSFRFNSPIFHVFPIRSYCCIKPLGFFGDFQADLRLMHLVMFCQTEEIDSEDIFNALERIAIGLEKKDEKHAAKTNPREN